MRATQYLLATLKKASKNCEVISHQLMLRSGMIRQVSSGLYTWLPTGLRVLRKIENIIREEMNKIGFIEIFMPIVQPAILWKQSGRWSKYGTELLRFKNRNNQELLLSPTHEEIISDLIYKESISSKQFPINVYQINTKYRDEARPRFGMIRSREFIMKDGYSFHINQTSLQNTYDDMYQKYNTIFNRIGLNFCIVQADPGKMGGILSHEFQAYSNHGEDMITVSMSNENHNKLNNCSVIYNNVAFTKIQSSAPKETMRLVETSGIYSISDLLTRFNLSIKKFIKIIIVRSNNKYTNNSYNFLGLVIRGDHKLSYKKLLMHSEIDFPLSIINIEEAKKIIGVKPTLFNCLDLSIPLIIDHNVAMMSDFIAESNISGKYFFGINWNRDLPCPKIADLYEPTNNNCNKNLHQHNTLLMNNSVEIGHIFQLGDKYSNNINSHIFKNNKRNSSTVMGCYGIGISRIVPVIIEQNYDNNGIIWPDAIAPFKLAIIPINMYYSVNVKNIAEKLYNQLLCILGVDVFFDDRQERPGAIFADIDLIGIPHIIIISDRNLNNKEVEYKNRKTGTIKKIKLDIVLQFLIKKTTNK